MLVGTLYRDIHRGDEFFGEPMDFFFFFNFSYACRCILNLNRDDEVFGEAASPVDFAKLSDNAPCPEKLLARLGIIYIYMYVL